MDHLLHLARRDKRGIHYVDTVFYREKQYQRYLLECTLSGIDASGPMVEFPDSAIVLHEFVNGRYLANDGSSVIGSSPWFPTHHFDNVESARASGLRIFDASIRKYVA